MLRFTYNGYRHNDLRYTQDKEIDGTYSCDAICHAEYRDMQRTDPKKYSRPWEDLPVCYYFGVDSSIVDMDEFTVLVHYLEKHYNDGVSQSAVPPTAEQVGKLVRKFSNVVLAAYISAVPTMMEGFVN